MRNFRTSIPNNLRSAPAGFTLLELLVVLVILGLLAAVATPQVMKYLSRAKTQSAALQIHNLASALDLYRLDVGRYPTQEEGLNSLVDAPPDTPNWNGPYVKKREMLLDPWAHAYHYKIPGDHGDYDLFSGGADNAVGGEGENQDVTNW
jgi:general secretion pathway protein G